MLRAVPGLYLLTRFSMIAPAVVLEGRSAGESFTRSSELTSGHKWTILWVILIFALASGIVSGLLVSLLAFLPDFFQNWLGNLAGNVLINPFAAVAITVMYFKLRGEREDEPAPAAATA